MDRLADPVERVPPWLLFSTSFWGGFQIMALEICGFRTLQTNLGSSVLVTGTLLTVVMILLSAGYYTGGLLSAKFRTTRALFGLLALASLYSIVVTVMLAEPVVSLGAAVRDAFDPSPYLRTALPAALLTLVLYGPQVFLMSMISPYWIRLQTVGATGQADPGVQSGLFMSLSTVGSIAGTMLASYVLVPFAGVATTAWSTSLVFLALALLGYFRASTPRGAWVVKALITLGALALGFVLLRPALPERDASILVQEESLYGEIRVDKETDDAGRTLLAYRPSRVYTHSILYPDEPLRDLEGLMYLVPGLVRAPQKVLVLGSAVGGVLRGIEVAFPRAHTVGVDLDPAVHRVATELFGVKPQHSTLVTADARVFLEQDRERYDLIIVDLFAGEFIPTHCVSREFFELVERRLTPGGGVFVNTNMNDVHHELARAAEPSRPVRNLHATLRAAGFAGLFENSYFHSIFAFRDARSIAELRTQLLAKMTDPALPLSLRTGAGIAIYTTVEVPRDRAQYRAFTDEWAPSLLIEAKSNAPDIYRALERMHLERNSGVSDLVLEEQLRGWDERDEPALRDLDALVRRLDARASGLPAPAIDDAARYFRFSSELAEPTVAAQSPWAKLATLYARVERLGRHNDYEALYPVLEELRAYL